MNENTKKWNKSFLIILAFAVVIRIILFYELPHAIFYADSGGYANDAINLIENGQLYEKHRTIGYPLFLTSIIMIFNDFLAVVIIQSILGLLLAILFYHLFWHLYPNKVFSLILFSVIALGTHQIAYEKLIAPELLYTLFLGFCFWIIIKIYKEPKLLYFGLLGIVCAFTILIKPASNYFIWLVNPFINV